MKASNFPRISFRVSPRVAREHRSSPACRLRDVIIDRKTQSWSYLRAFISEISQNVFRVREEHCMFINNRTHMSIVRRNSEVTFGPKDSALICPNFRILDGGLSWNKEHPNAKGTNHDAVNDDSPNTVGKPRGTFTSGLIICAQELTD